MWKIPRQAVGKSYKCDTGRESRQMMIKLCDKTVIKPNTEQNPNGDKTWLLGQNVPLLIICYIDTPPRHFDNILLASGNVRADRRNTEGLTTRRGLYYIILG